MIHQEGLTIVQLKCISNEEEVKVEIAVAKGKVIRIKRQVKEEIAKEHRDWLQKRINDLFEYLIQPSIMAIDIKISIRLFLT